VGGAAVPATAWIELGTDQALATYTRSVPWSFTGDRNLSTSVTGLTPATTYAARLAVQTSGGIGKSAIRLFATIVAPPLVALAPAAGASSTATINAGQTATYKLVVSDGGNGYVGSAALSCSAVLTGATCSVIPSAVNIAVNPTPFTVTVTTTAPSIALQRPVSSDLVLASGLFLGIGALAIGMKRHSLSLLICIGVLSTFAFVCGSSGSRSTGGAGPTPPPPTPSGTYFLTINAYAGGEAQSSELLTLTVK
jgi:hypothetical protein